MSAPDEPRPASPEPLPSRSEPSERAGEPAPPPPETRPATSASGRRVRAGRDVDIPVGLAVGVLLALLAAFLFVQWFATDERREDLISYDAFKAAIRAGEVAEVTSRGREVHGTYRPIEGTPLRTGFRTVLPAWEDPELPALLERAGVVQRAQADEPWIAERAVEVLLLVGLLLLLWLLLSSRLPRPPVGFFRIGRFRVRRRSPTTNVTFGDVAGLDEAKSDLREIVDFLEDADRFRKMGARIPKGVLLQGPPGTGKTLLARAVAGEAGVPFFPVGGSEFVELYAGVGASRVRDLFRRAKRAAPSIIFIDEIDAVGRLRAPGSGGGSDEREQTLNQLLQELDGFEQEEEVIVIAATNRPDVLDPALLRPGRFDRRIAVERLARGGRAKILGVHVRGKPLAAGVALDRIAAGTPGFSGAELQNLVNEAAILATRKRKAEIGMEEFEEAKDRILRGVICEGYLSPAERRRAAYHEAGHALVARLAPGADPVHKVSIIPRARSLGATELVPEHERSSYTRSQLDGLLAFVLGGRAAEEIALADVSTGAEDDLARVTALAYRMVTDWGMSDIVGPVRYTNPEAPSLDHEPRPSLREVAEETRVLLDREAKKIVALAHERARSILAEHRASLDALAEALLADEVLDAAEVDRVVTAPEPSPSGRGRSSASPRTG